MFYTIYKITHVSSGKTYIGKHQTDNLDDGYMGSGKHLKRAISKHGLDAFEKIILHVFDNENDMNAKEAELVTEEFCSRDDTYNLCPGGKGGWGYVNQHQLGGFSNHSYNGTKEHSISSRNGAISLNTKIPPTGKNLMEYQILNGNPFLGKNHSEETKRKIGEANSIKQSGKNNSQYGLQWITNGLESKKIRKDDLIPEGWRKGRKMKG